MKNCFTILLIIASPRTYSQTFLTGPSPIFSRLYSFVQPEDFRGHVETVVTTTHNKTGEPEMDSVVITRYDHKGRLMASCKGDSSNHNDEDLDFETLQYNSVSGRISEHMWVDYYGTETNTYDTSGLITQLIRKGKEGRSGDLEEYYTYIFKTDTIIVRKSESYSGVPDTSKNTVSTFILNKNGLPIFELDSSDMGGQATFTYDSLGRLTGNSFLSDCYGENSCPSTGNSYRYDSRGNIIEETASDATIRNSNWCYCYDYVARYDSHDNMIEQKYLYEGAPAMFCSNYSRLITIKYTYDTSGNWIKKITYENNVLQNVVNRTITYY